jgi:hypothetical protein
MLHTMSLDLNRDVAAVSTRSQHQQQVAATLSDLELKLELARARVDEAEGAVKVRGLEWERVDGRGAAEG